MAREMRGARPTTGDIVPNCGAALRQLEASRARDPMVLAYWPASRSNPYQALLYQRAWDHNVAPVPVHDLRDIDALPDLVRGRARAVLHVHWTLEVLRGIDEHDEAERALAAFTARLDAFLAHGGILAWSVHNVLPHDCLFPDLEAKVQQELVDRATVVHVLARTTPEVVADRFTIPAGKVLHVAHPHYLHAYPDVVGRDQARFDLGVEPDHIVLATVGSLQPYKGLDDLVDAVDVLDAEDPGRYRLVIAGAPSSHPEMTALLDRCELSPAVDLRRGRVRDDDLQRYLKAADVVVLPYRRTLNSGALLLAIGFGAPVVVPRTGGMVEVADASFASFFDPASPGSLLPAIRDAVARLRTAQARDAARAAALAYDPAALSDRFVTELRARALRA